MGEKSMQVFSSKKGNKPFARPRCRCWGLRRTTKTCQDEELNVLAESELEIS
jgi:hypothetical protein